MNIKFKLFEEDPRPLHYGYITKIINTNNLNHEDLQILLEHFRKQRGYLIEGVKDVEHNKETNTYKIGELILGEFEIK